MVSFLTFGHLTDDISIYIFPLCDKDKVNPEGYSFIYIHICYVFRQWRDDSWFKGLVFEALAQKDNLILNH